MKLDEFEQSNEFQNDRRETKISFLRRKRAGVKMLEKPALSGAKVATFNDRGNVSGHIFDTFY